MMCTPSTGPAAPVIGHRRHLVAPPRVRLVLLLALFVLAAPVTAQAPEEVPADVFAWRLNYQKAQELLPLVESLLSPNGTVELHTAWNLLVFHDDKENLDRIRAFVADFDHPPRELTFDIVILRASQDPQAGADDEAPPWLAKGVGRILKFPSYRSLGRVRIGLREGQTIEYTIGGHYAVRFEAGTVFSRRIRLRRFEILAGSERERRIFAADLSLNLDRPQVLGFARDEETGVELVVALLVSQEESRDSGGGS